jgi:hypothetical protein
MTKEGKSMKLYQILTANAVLCALFGLGFVTAPAMQFATFGAETSALAELVARVYGSALLGYALTSWVSRNAGPSPARSAIVVGNLIFHLLGAALLLMGYLAGTLNTMAWLAIVLSLLLALGFAMTGVGRASERVLSTE